MQKAFMMLFATMFFVSSACLFEMKLKFFYETIKRNNFHPIRLMHLKQRSFNSLKGQ